MILPLHHRSMTSKVCPGCSNIFDCRAGESSCWCFSVTLDSNALQNIREIYEDCLCKECLSKYETPSTERS
ncbi:hypothetical protein EHQ27_13620 [Leptospira wolffii]|nr:hypothetical protein EHQ32_04180 [Leptospira wolffii]TGK68644.1 hypothetical protein EHQ27_13620 [Leptospira wolffii]TGK74572.1 hypothetical protein EHQ35_09600 [Leptospira wolffii]TGL31852.1 hypothetical protein EHQ57_03075 [Leptospira wolffii]